MTTPTPSRRTLGLLAVIGLATIGLVGLIKATEPEATQEGAVKRTAALVEVTSVEHGTFEPVVSAMGVVRPVQDVVLEPQVTSPVQRVSDAFVPGRVVDAGTLLVGLDPADATHLLAQRRAEHAQAEADLRLERGRQSVARIERDHIRGDVSPEQEALILREPQRHAAEATVASAATAVAQAELALARTRITAPFRALVLERNAHVGSRVGPGTALGRLVDVSQYWVELTVPTADLRHLPLDHGHATGSPVWIHDRAAWPEGVTREGRLISVVRQLDDQTRMARLLVAVDDPLGLDHEGPPLSVGAWVQARLATAPLRDVVRIDRRHLRGGSTVWTLVGGALAIRPVTVVMQDDAYAYLSEGLPPDAVVVTTDLSTVRDGIPLRTVSP